MYRLICQKPAHFLSAQMASVVSFFQMFIVLGMYNFDSGQETSSLHTNVLSGWCLQGLASTAHIGCNLENKWQKYEALSLDSFQF